MAEATSTGAIDPDPQALAERAAAAMRAGDRAMDWFGFQLEAVGPGWAEVSLLVAAAHCNGHGNLHGGVSYALADTAFAYACNSRDARTVALSNQITYLAPGRVGDRLVARADEQALVGRSGIYDVSVARADGTVIALFRGQSRAIGGSLTGDQDAARHPGSPA